MYEYTSLWYYESNLVHVEKSMNDYEKILQIAKKNNDIFKTKMIVDAGIRKEKIRELLAEGKIKRIGHGYYTISNGYTDKYYEIQQRCPKAIFSFETAAYLWNLTNTEPKVLDCTVPRGYNTSRLNIGNNIQFHYVLQDYYGIGLLEESSPQSSLIRLYDRERTICDLIRHRKQIQPAVYSHMINQYFQSCEKDIQKLAKYSRIFHVVKELEMYMEVL